MNITVISSGPLSEETKALLAKLYETVDQVMAVGEYRMGFRTAKIRNGILYWPKVEGGYLAIDSLIRKMHDADTNLKRLDENFSVDLDDVAILAEVLEECLKQAEGGMFNPSRRLQRAVQSMLYSFKNLFPGMKSYMGQPLNEEFVVLRVSFDYYARKVIAAGEEAMKLVNSKIIDGRLFLKSDDGYLVVDPDSQGGSSLFRCPDLNFANAKAVGGISFANERQYRDMFISWLNEAGL
ncbi:hypothetical protein A3K29_01750 [Candidatus Collierbacteria bacterium RIFOXYB2_FULL_46_14]|uniref:Uncharacterized protein n=1 Tax=Candidatus Collierbacteria bacterium GW2011_GWA2_46_26 TaxID=1618381 RepID=A0A0G1SHR7_9BACT|nr:MAG: hypothetical protein UW29_C0006G0090 [Candidatus Collierbacteria bacterium GW2011_GWC2_44_13]KKU32875.1 MAG: hypothetical protein UX47_C0007G0119 [Candidatus Collierbacteria bacterium GW2011_GWA2_46_26]OGD72853.1 MAG: hypothetical protein A3K29_01750 [Candidatus Collierbacteria bacterium RIFOXYB2_FULL_46_14]OGD75895.1 MAG: hypothetical protein A3K43_01750 [Candidatus Collierbacteria bacterium RIFOXYA2_FULL_46_20]OGD77231.1 MAG: hypothetical protein A3K39_01750 [Candidatus Collierbacteri